MGDSTDVSTTEIDTVANVGNNTESGRRTGFLSGVLRDSRSIEGNKREVADTGTGSEPDSGTNPEPRKPGRPRKPRDASGNIIRDGNASKPTQGTGEGSGNGSSGRAEGTATETVSVGSQQEGVTVEKPGAQPTPTPQPKKPRRTRGKKSRGPVTQEHVTAWTVQVFSIAAMFKRAEYWKVQRPDIEVDPWAGSAADLINEHVDTELAEKALALNAGVAVAVGISAMVMSRLQVDYEMKRAAIAAQKPQPKPAQQTPQQEPSNVRPMRGTGNEPGGGASPTRPTEPLTGLGMDVGGLK